MNEEYDPQEIDPETGEPVDATFRRYWQDEDDIQEYLSKQTTSTKPTQSKPKNRAQPPPPAPEEHVGPGRAYFRAKREETRGWARAEAQAARDGHELPEIELPGAPTTA